MPRTERVVPPERTSGRQEPDRNLRISTRGNAAFKWKADPTVVGALEVISIPALNPRAHLKEHVVPTVQTQYQECLEVFHHHKLHKSLVEALESIPPETKCCGMITDDHATIRNVVPLLNDGWAKTVTEKYFESKGYRISCFVWTWSNVTGAAENVVLLIRFHTLNEPKRNVPTKKE